MRTIWHMIKTLIKLLLWNFLRTASAFPLRSSIQPINRNLLRYYGGPENIRDIFIPEANGIEHSQIPDYNDVLQSGRQRRDVEIEDFGIDNVSFEVPTIMRVNDSRGDAQANLISSIGANAQFLSGNPVCNQPKPTVPPKPPISLTFCLDNIFPPGKANKYFITNSSELRGSGALIKINFCELRTTTQNPDLVFSFDLSSPVNRVEHIESQGRKKNDEDDEDTSEQKTLQEILRKILTGRINSTTLPSEELSAFIRNSTGEPLTLILNPSLFNKLPNKSDSTTSHWRTTYTSRSPNPPDYEYLSKMVEQISSNIPREKLASLLTGLIAKAYPVENKL